MIPSPGDSVEALAVIIPTAAQLPVGAVVGAAMASKGSAARIMN